MNPLKNLKLGPKLIMSFIGVALLIVFVAIVGYINLKGMNDITNDLYDNHVLAMEDLAHANLALYTIRGDVYKYFLVPAERAALDQSLETQIKTVNDSIAHFRTTDLSQEELASLAKFDTSWATYQQAVAVIMQDLKAGNDSKAMEGLAGTGTAATARTTMLGVTEGLMKGIEGMAADLDQKANATSQSATLVGAGAGVLGVLIAVVLGFILTRSIVNPVEQVKKTAQQIADVDLQALAENMEALAQGDVSREMSISAQTMNISSHDEVGQLGEAFNAMIARLQQVGSAFGNVSASLRNLVDETKGLTQAAADGKLSTRGETNKYQGGYRDIVQGLNSTLDAVIEPINDTQKILGEIARGDLTVHMNGHYKGDYVQLKNSIESMLGGLKGMASQTQEGTVQMTSATAQILASSTQMASSTREQASAVNEVTSTVREIKASAEQVAQRAQGVANSASQAVTAVEDGLAAVEEATAGMEDIRTKVEAIAENILALSEQTQQIGEIIDTVSDIAGQSNILALNAAIEAAQAGEAGKGFRVVADEVRTLAEQSRQAAAQVKIILNDIQKATNLAVMATEQGTKGVQAGSEMVHRTAQRIQDLAKVVEQSASASQQIVAGVEQQTIGLDQIVIGMNDINQASQQTAEGATQSQRAAQDLNQLSEQLKLAAGQYRLN